MPKAGRSKKAEIIEMLMAKPAAVCRIAIPGLLSWLGRTEDGLTYIDITEPEPEDWHGTKGSDIRVRDDEVTKSAERNDSSVVAASDLAGRGRAYGCDRCAAAYKVNSWRRRTCLR